MLRSMTGFARETTQGPWGELSWELRSVNHRYLDLSLRLPEELRALESEVRAQVAEKLGRGKLEANLRLRVQAAEGQALEINVERLQEVAKACHAVGAGDNGARAIAGGARRIPGPVADPRPGNPGTCRGSRCRPA